ncbi:SWIM zinc finger family protein [Pseudonocardia sp. TRM90224]|uniref:SWIM zinc finger family protein n=1 Tax=Pseudonocardia sp. TRM90224 TaxID=2812678 RepID=UPI001E5BAA19|nr:SWIM zinc finger family protein [Pseudonocardia sp. TRM90224]
MGAAVHTYRYRSGSTVGERSRSVGLATSGGTALTGPSVHPFFYRGRLPASAAEGVLAVAKVAHTRYYQPSARASLDPVVTCSGDRLRFESFSGCCGVYARLDVLSGALDGEVVDRGTTNVDVNEPLRRALSRVVGRDPLHVSVGSDRMVVTTRETAVEERKVPLPSRWLRGFAETQVITAGFDLRAELAGADAVRFVRSLPRGVRGPMWAVPAGRTLRLSGRPAAGAVCVAGPYRLEAIGPLLPHARSMRVYGPAAPPGRLPSVSAWELDLGHQRMVLVLSPEISRGLSGEGAVLDALTAPEGASDAELVGSLLTFEPRIEIAELAQRSGLSEARVRAALTRLGTSGRVGFDLAESAHFHRELPFDGQAALAANPRLANANSLVTAGAVRLEGDAAVVTAAGREYHVRGTSCTCTWWVEYRGTRGKCQHVLAADIVRGRS